MEAEFERVAGKAELGPGEMIRVRVGGVEICLTNVEGEYLAIGNVCTHDGGPLDEGTLEVDEVECPWHGSRFDVRTGEPVMAPATEGVRVHPVRVDGDDIWVGAR